MSSVSRFSIPNSVRKTIQNIKEITGNHSEEDIYAMLKECSMDPNETVDKLLLQDPFLEVKRKRDRKKENLSNKESGELRWKTGTQGRGSRGGRANYSRYVSNDASSGRNFASVKEIGINQISDKVDGFSSLPTSQETKKDITLAKSSPTVPTNGPSAGSPGHTDAVHAAYLDAGSLASKSEEISAINIGKLEGAPALIQLVTTKENPNMGFGKEHLNEQLESSSSNSSTAGAQAASPGVYFSTSDPVLVPSHDSRLAGAVGAIKCQVGSQQTPVEQNSLALTDGKSTDASEIGSSSMQGNMPTISTAAMGKDQLLDSTQPALSTHVGSSVIRPSSSHNSRSQQAFGSQKVGPNKEWKPKPHPNHVQGSGTAGSSEVPTIVEASTKSCPVSDVLDSKEATSKLQGKLEELHVSDGQQVIIPNHIHVPEAEKTSFCFGSFDASYSGLENESNPTSVSENSECVEETEEQDSSKQNVVATMEEGDCHDHPQSPRHRLENLSSGAGNVSSTTVPDYDDSKQENVLQPGRCQFPIIHNSPSYSFGFMPSMVGGQHAPLESIESQARDVPRVPSFVIPQLLDPASYYAQFYRSGADSDGRISPFHASGVTTKYNGNAAVLSPQASQSAQVGGNSLVLSTECPTAPVTHAAEVMQSSLALTHQPLPVFRHPTGMPIPHYHSNYIPYSHYISPFYVSPPSIHQILSNGAFPQQPQAGSIYPAPPGATTAKYSLPQYKLGNNTGNPSHVVVAGSYGYGSSPAGYNPSSTSTAGDSSANDDLATSQFKESNIYNIPPQGPVAFTSPQSHGTFTGIYHPAQTVSAASVHPLLQQSQTMASPVDIPGPATAAYQSQHAQFNWAKDS